MTPAKGEWMEHACTDGYSLERAPRMTGCNEDFLVCCVSDCLLRSETIFLEMPIRWTLCYDKGFQVFYKCEGSVHRHVNRHHPGVLCLNALLYYILAWMVQA